MCVMYHQVSAVAGAGFVLGRSQPNMAKKSKLFAENTHNAPSID